MKLSRGSRISEPKPKTGTALKRTAIKKRRSKPRRGVAKDPAYLSYIGGLPCLLVDFFVPSTCEGRLTVHHVRANGSPKNDRDTVPLCEAHHLHDFGSQSIERMGKRKWQEYFSVDLCATIAQLQEEYTCRSGL